MLGLPFNPRPIAPAYLPIDEAHPTQAQEPYALSKRLCEEIVTAATLRSDMTAVSLRMPWIQTRETFAREVAPRRGDPAVAAGNLWSYIDARDAAALFVAALEVPVEGHARVYVSAPDTFMAEETAVLVARTFPGVETRRAFSGFESVLDTSAADALLGVRAERSWRDYAAVTV
jgi:nucleoside-diphosphate-sugar epimerase